jgi:hypothetical protein
MDRKKVSRLSFINTSALHRESSAQDGVTADAEAAGENPCGGFRGAPVRGLIYKKWPIFFYAGARFGQNYLQNFFFHVIVDPRERRKIYAFEKTENQAVHPQHMFALQQNQTFFQ